MTKVTLHPGVGADRVTRMWYDWRDRLFAVASEVNITYSELDNLGRAVRTMVYEPTAQIGTSNGVPHNPSSNDAKMRSMTRTEYDSRGRAFRSTMFAVDGVSGASSDPQDEAGMDKLVSGYWYDQRDNLVKTSNPGGLVDKSQYDRADRAIVESAADGGGDDPTGEDDTWVDAMGLTGDIIVERVATDYDKNGNPIFLTSTQYGSEGGSRTTRKANWYDLADRLMATADAGTMAYARPEEPPAWIPSTATATSTDEKYLVVGGGGHVPRGASGRRRGLQLPGRAGAHVLRAGRRLDSGAGLGT